MLRSIIAIVLMMTLSGCVTKQVGLTYSAPPGTTASIADQNAIVTVTTVVDKRTNDPHWLGAIRGGYGNPLKILKTDEPVSKLVGTAFSDGLAARGMLAGPNGGRIQASLVIYRLDCNQLVRREAHADIAVTLTNAQTGQVIYTDRVSSDAVDGSLFALDVGVFASTEQLRQLAVKTMDDAINKALDKPAFQAALAGVAKG